MAKHNQDAGNYDKRMVLKRPTETNTKGTVTEAYYDVGEVWCSLRPKGARVLYDSAIVQAQVTHIARTWWRPDLSPTPTWQLYWEDAGRTFEITGVLNVDEANVEWEFHLCEVV